jgi:Zn-dependent peptidase ImmA (M78 family)
MTVKLVTPRTGPGVHSGEARADAARHELGLGVDAPIDVLAAVEGVGAVPVCIAEFPSDTAGVFLDQHERKYIFVNGVHPVVRQRFTLAHEFGHAFMNHEPRVETTTAMLSSDPQEVEANYFAGAFLAPRQAIRNWAERLTSGPSDLELVVMMSAFFGTSAEASRIRLELTGLLPHARGLVVKQAVKAGAHYGMVGSLGLSPFADGLSRLHRDVEAQLRDLPRLPAEMVRAAQSARERDLVDDETVEAVLRGTPLTVEEDVEE